MTEPLVSIVIPTYNRPYSLDELLTALAMQTWTDFEVIIYNDGGTDVSHVVKRYTNLDVTVLAGANGGHVHARNEALQVARGQYVMPIDDDDLIVPTHLDRLVREMEDADLVYADAEVVVWQMTPEGRVPLERRPFAFKFAIELLRQWNLIIPSGILYRKSLHSVLGLFDESVSHYWDWDFVLRVATDYRVKRVPCASVLYAMDLAGDNASSEPMHMQTALAHFCDKHALGDLPSSNFYLMTQDGRLDGHRQPTEILWNGAPIRRSVQV